MFIKTTPEARPRKAQGQGGAAEQDATPSERILIAAEIIGLRGPLTYKELERALNLSKAATWRLVATLRDAQWVRFRQNGRLIELDPRVDEVFARAHFADAEFLEVAEVITEVAGRHQVHIDLFSPNRRDGSPCSTWPA